MKRINTASCLFIILLAGMILLSPFTSYAKDESVKGVVKALSVSEDGKVESVMISNKKGQYIVEEGKEGAKLFSLVGKRVNVTGSVVKEGDENYITVKKIKILKKKKKS